MNFYPTLLRNQKFWRADINVNEIFKLCIIKSSSTVMMITLYDSTHNIELILLICNGIRCNWSLNGICLCHFRSTDWLWWTDGAEVKKGWKTINLLISWHGNFTCTPGGVSISHDKISKKLLIRMRRKGDQAPFSSGSRPRNSNRIISSTIWQTVHNNSSIFERRESA